MPRRTRAAAAVPPPLEGVMALPPELQQQILGQLDLNTRLTTAALVCTRWRDLSVSRELMQTIEACVPEDGNWSALLARMESFCAWLCRHAAPHVRRLRIVVNPSLSADLGPDGGEAGELFMDAIDELGAALAELGPHRRLEDLCLCWHQDSSFGSLSHMELRRKGAAAWPHALRRSLRRLCLNLEPMMLHVEAPLQALTALEELQLKPLFVDLGRHVMFPPYLTSLVFEGWGERPLGPALGALTRLVDVTIGCHALEADAYGVLERLYSLRRLRLRGCEFCPSNLSRLSQLTALYLQSTPNTGTAAQALQASEAGLAGLPQLRHLSISPKHAAMPFPGPVAAMAHLHSLAWVPARASAPSEAWSPVPPLPPGEYLPSLRRLVVPAAMAAASLDVLAAASGLQALALSSFADASTTEQAALMQWAAAHPALRQLSIELSGRYLCAATVAAVNGVLHQPALQLKIEPVKALAWEAWDEAPAGLEEPWQLPDSWA